LISCYDINVAQDPSQATPSVSVSPRARDELARACPPNAVVELSATPGGCCGDRYGLAVREMAPPGVTYLDLGDVRLVIDPRSVRRCDGVSIDYLETPDGAGFLVRGPVGAAGCGCGRR
jgi:iron-sulfur cluster assembly accessory protein